jgi:hypothetical protein
VQNKFCTPDERDNWSAKFILPLGVQNLFCHKGCKTSFALRMNEIIGVQNSFCHKEKNMLLRYLILLIGFWISFPTQAARHALVIGNQNYEVKPLYNPKNDAQDMSNVLKNLDFRVTLLIDINKRQMEEAVRNFANSLRNNDVALFYFSGHGIEIDKVNYLVPLVSSRIHSAVDAKYEFYNAQRVLDEMKRTNINGVNMMILDACRDNPFKSLAKSVGSGLAEMSAPTGSLIAYATSPGFVAWGDSRERNSIYTKHLLTALQTKTHLSILDLLTDVTGAVSTETQNQQVPWKHDSLTRRFCLTECGVDRQINAMQRQIDELKKQLAQNQHNPQLQAQVEALERQTQSTKTTNVYKPGETFQLKLKDGSLGPKMVVIPKGSFRMGDIQGGGYDDEKPVHQVTINYDFAMSQYEVTKGELLNLLKPQAIKPVQKKVMVVMVGLVANGRKKRNLIGVMLVLSKKIIILLYV